MAKFNGKVGYVIDKEIRPGVFKTETTIRPYFGDLLSDIQTYQLGDTVNGETNLANKISIVADKFAYENLGYMKFIEYMNGKWIIRSIETKYPRLILTIGGKYNGTS